MRNVISGEEPANKSVTVDLVPWDGRALVPVNQLNGTITYPTAPVSVRSRKQRAYPRVFKNRFFCPLELSVHLRGKRAQHRLHLHFARFQSVLTHLYGCSSILRICGAYVSSSE